MAPPAEEAAAGHGGGGGGATGSAASPARRAPAEAYKAGAFEEAEAGYTEALQRAPDAAARSAALASRAQCRLKLGRRLAAREDALAARSVAPENAKAWYRLGVCEAQLSRLPEAEAALAEAARLLGAGADAGLLAALGEAGARRREAEGRFDWEALYARYLVKERVGLRASSGGGAAVAAPTDDGSVLFPLAAEPFVGPIRVGLSKGRGRGLFATEDVKAGELVLCAQAAATQENGKLRQALREASRRSASFRAAVLNLSRGTAESESVLPYQELLHLAAPRRSVDADEEEDVDAADGPTDEELDKILYFNQFSLPCVNANAAPIEVTNDPARSGLWVLPAFVNHSCLPNVQRLIVWDCLFLRAARDIRAGEELFDCYIESLQPLARRRASLQSYGIEACGCERCLLEASALGPEAVEPVLEAAAKVTEVDSSDGARCAELAEEAAELADAAVAMALERALSSGAVPRTEHLPLPDAPIPAQRMGVLREGFEKFTDAAEELAFERQERLHWVLLGGLANVLRGHALSLRGLNRYVDSALAWGKVYRALEQVIPCSELLAIVACEEMMAKLLSSHLDFRKVGRAATRRSLLACHRAYDGGYPVWRLLHSQAFAASVVQGAGELWAELRRELGLPDEAAAAASSKGAAAAAVAAASTTATAGRVPQRGFEDLLKSRARERDGQGDGGGAAAADAAPRSSPSAAASAAASAAGAAPSASSAGAGAAAAAPGHSGAAVGGVAEASLAAAAPTEAVGEQEEAGYEVLGGAPGEPLSVVVRLPGLASAAEAELEVAEEEVRIRSLRPDFPHAFDIPLPCAVDPASCAAKWSKRSCKLSLKLLRL